MRHWNGRKEYAEPKIMWHQKLGWPLKPGDLELSFCWQYRTPRQERKPTEDPLINLSLKGLCLQYTYKGGTNPTMQDESTKQHVCLQTDARSRGRTCPWKSVKAQAGSGTGLWSEVTLCGLRLLRGEFNSKKFWEMPPGDRQTLLGVLFQLIAELSTQASKNVYRKKMLRWVSSLL